MLSEMESFWRVVSREAIRSLQLQERRHGKEATALILERNDDDLGHGSAAEISKKWSDSEYILRVQPTDFQTDHMWVLKGRGVKDISKLLAWASGRKELLTFKIRGFNLIIQTSSFFHNTRKRGQLYICIFNKTEVQSHEDYWQPWDQRPHEPSSHNQHAWGCKASFATSICVSWKYWSRASRPSN